MVPMTETSDPRQPSRFEKNANTPVNRESPDPHVHLIHFTRNLADCVNQPVHLFRSRVASAAGADNPVFRLALIVPSPSLRKSRRRTQKFRVPPVSLATSIDDVPSTVNAIVGVRDASSAGP